jgi:hypothetical protein
LPNRNKKSEWQSTARDLFMLIEIDELFLPCLGRSYPPSYPAAGWIIKGWLNLVSQVNAFFSIAATSQWGASSSISLHT